MNNEDLMEFYNQKTKKTETILKNTNKKIRNISLLRLMVVISIALSFVFFSSVIGWSVLSLGIICFLFFVKIHEKLFEEREYLEAKLDILEKELNVLKNNDFSNFENGEEFIDSSHDYSFDLDLFGDKSFFQMLNRTSTIMGKLKLKDLICNPLTSVEKIKKQQSTIKELSNNNDFLLDLRTLMTLAYKDSKNELSNSINYNLDNLENSFWRYIIYIPIIIITITSILCLIGIWQWQAIIFVFVMLFLFAFLPMTFVGSKIKIAEKLNKKVKSQKKILKKLQNSDFNSEKLQQIKSEFFNNKVNVIDIYDQLDLITNNLALSYTILGVVTLNPILFWHVYYAMKFQKWLNAYSSFLDKTDIIIGEIDSLISLANYSFNNKQFIYPEITESEIIYEGKDLGHPLMTKDNCVTNDINIGEINFNIITGANMSGKSTYLRTIGINLLMAEMGMPVFAKTMNVYPFKLMTNLRVSDSLVDNESYFFAELKKMKIIIDELQSGSKIFIILDEILKGTNSRDKQKGSLALMRQLIEDNGYGAIATHDLILGNLKKDYPQRLENFRFESEIKNDDLFFTYKRQEGIAKNMNACFLMKKMGIANID